MYGTGIPLTLLINGAFALLVFGATTWCKHRKVSAQEQQKLSVNANNNDYGIGF